MHSTSNLERFIGTLTDLPDGDAIWAATKNFGYALGFSDCSLTLARKGSCGIHSPTVRSSFSEKFLSAYIGENLVKSDPFLLFSCKNLVASKFLTKDLSNIPNPDPAHRMFLELTANENETVGAIGIPVRTDGNEKFGGWLFSVNESEYRLDDLIGRHGKDIHLASVLAYERLAAMPLEEKVHPKLLSNRERECLTWLCAGLRVVAIAEKLSISNSAVNLYINNAKNKLGAKTREQAVARALISSEITL